MPPSTTIATSTLGRLIPSHAASTSTTSAINATAPSATARDTRNRSPVTSSTPLITTTPATAPSTHPTPGGAAAAAALARRDSSADPLKRRRLGLPGNSSLRQSSLGPGTAPKSGSLSAPSGTPRAGSAGPRSGARKPGRGGVLGAAGVARLGLLNPTLAGATNVGPNGTGAGVVGKKATRRKARKGKGGGVSDTGEESAVSEVEEGEEGENGDVTMGEATGGADEEGDGDDRKYCTCRSVSYGNMVACDNDACRYEWFHWSCVGMTKEPLGKWYCEDCRTAMK